MDYTFSPSKELLGWLERGHSRSQLMAAYAAAASHEHLALLEIHPDGRVSLSGSHEINAKYYQLTVALFTAALMLVPPPKPGIAVIGLHDAIWTPHVPHVPVIGFSKRVDDSVSLLTADPHFISTDGYEEYREVFHALGPTWPWEKRHATAFWRGVTTGAPVLTKETWRDNPRIRLCALSKELNNTDTLDAAITYVEQCDDPEVVDAIHASGMMALTVSPKVYLQYKYIINIDGNASAWGLFWKFLFKSTVIMVEGRFEQWYYHLLRPWEHYIPVKADLSDLLEKIHWAQTHDEECRQIAERACAVVTPITRESACWELGKILHALMSTQIPS